MNIRQVNLSNVSGIVLELKSVNWLVLEIVRQLPKLTKPVQFFL